MRKLVPDFILSKAASKHYSGRLKAIVLNIDLSGFTLLSHELMTRSDAGAEVLSDAINAIFTPALSAIESRGGFIAGFAGDAFTAVFPQRCTKGALSSALFIRDFFVQKDPTLGQISETRLAARIGIASGELQWKIYPGSSLHSFSFHSDGVDKAVNAQEIAPLNGIVIDERLRSDLDGCLITHSMDTAGFYLVREASITLDPKAPVRGRLPQTDFIPARILELRSDGEFRQVLSCFINILKPSEALILEIMELAERYGGYFNKIDFTDKGWLALVLFGAPVEYEKTALRALEFAHDVSALTGQSGRIGLSRGKAFAGFIGSKERGEYTAIGMAVNLAARLMFSASWGEILIDERIRREAAESITCDDLGSKAFKGFPHPIPVHRFLSLNAEKTRTPARTIFIGRGEEIKLLSSAIAKPSPSICHVYGEPGQGKTRLITELKTLHQDSARFIFLQCDSIRREDLNPFIGFIKHEFNELNSSGERARVNAFRKQWSSFTSSVLSSKADPFLKDELIRIESIIAALIGLEWPGSLYSGLSSSDRVGLLPSALFSLIRAFCMIRPVVLVFEDIHWIDPESAATMQFICRQAKDLPLTIIATARYADDGSRPILCAIEHMAGINICLDDLSRADSDAFTEAILNGKADPHLCDFLYSQANGNPFYTEQLSLFLRESGKVTLRDGSFRLDTSALGVPTGIQSLLVARLDRLDSGLRRLVQTASVIGREFALNILTELIQSLETDATGKTRERVLAGEKQKIWDMISEIRYIFYHTLMRDAAYQMQLRKNLIHLHLLTAKTMHELDPDDRSTLGEIAMHYEQGENRDQAIAFYNLAGDYDRENSHFNQSLHHYTRALELNLKAKPAGHPDIAQSYFNLGNICNDKGDYALSLKHHKKALSLRLKCFGRSHTEIARSYNNIGNTVRNLGQYKKALYYHRKALAIRLDLLGDKHPESSASYNNLGNAYGGLGDHARAAEYYRKDFDICLAVYGDKHPETALAYNNLGEAYGFMGELDKALEYHRKALKIRRASKGEDHPFTAWSYQNVGSAYCDLEDFAKALRYNRKALAIRQKIFGSLHPHIAMSYSHIGLAYAMKGDFKNALLWFLKELPVGLAFYGENHPETAISYGNIAEAYYFLNDLNNSLIYYLKAVHSRSASLGEDFWLNSTDFARIGSIYRSMGELDKAREYLLKAIAIFKKHDALGEQEAIDATKTLADIYEQNGDPEAAQKCRESLPPSDLI